jgi:lipopolysaccharide export system permease protein
MYILTRYVVWEVVKFFAAALIVLTMLFTLVMGVKVQRELGLPPLVLLRTTPLLLPEMFGITIPVAMLYAVSSVFGRMTGSNEIVALKSAGISPMAAIWPVLVLAGFFSLATVGMYEMAATWGRPGVKRVATESIEEIAYGMLQKSRSFTGDQFSMAVERVEGRTLIHPKITIKGPPRITLTAVEAKLHTDWTTHTLQIICRQGEVEVEGQMRMSFPDEQTWSVPIPDPPSERYHRDHVAMSAIPGLVGELKATRQLHQKLLDTDKALGVADLTPCEALIAVDDERIFRLQAEPFRRWSNGFACLCFALIGTPVAMLRRHADVLTNFFTCFLPILTVYYPLLMFGDKVSTSGSPPICLADWTGDLVLAIPAIILLRWIIRH